MEISKRESFEQMIIQIRTCEIFIQTLNNIWYFLHVWIYFRNRRNPPSPILHVHYVPSSGSTEHRRNYKCGIYVYWELNILFVSEHSVENMMEKSGRANSTRGRRTTKIWNGATLGSCTRAGAVRPDNRNVETSRNDELEKLETLRGAGLRQARAGPDARLEHMADR